MITGTVESFNVIKGFDPDSKWSHYGEATVVVNGQTFTGGMRTKKGGKITVGMQATVNPNAKKQNGDDIIEVVPAEQASSGGGYQKKAGAAPKKDFPTANERAATQERITRDAAVNKALQAIEIAVRSGAAAKKYSDPTVVIQEALVMADGIAKQIAEDKLSEGFPSKGEDRTAKANEAVMDAQAPTFDDEIPF
jgi:hypothetical protein